MFLITHRVCHCMLLRDWCHHSQGAFKMAVTYTESSSLPAAAPSGTDTYAQADLRTDIKE